MPMHALEKILANHAGKEEVSFGEIVNCKVDIAEVNDLYLQVIKSFYEMGGQRVKNPEAIAFVFDHYTPAPTIQSAANQKAMRDFIWNQGIGYLFDINSGVCHQVMPEAGIVRPGMILVATDSHATTHGAFGTLGTGVGATELAAIMLTGELWFRVPEIIRINIEGQLKLGVTAKDVILHIIGSLKQDVAVYKAIEYTGSTVSQLSVASRMVLCNMVVEMGAKTSYIQPDDKTLEYISTYSKRPFTTQSTDPGFQYNGDYHFNVTNLEPQVAVPHAIDQVVPISQAAGVAVDQVFIGSCTNGRVEDIKLVAQILNNKKVNPHCRLVIAPASRQVLLEATKAGYTEILLEAGATLATPGCGACLGIHGGIMAPGEVCVTTSSRNFPGRMGSTEAYIYVASPATAAAAALTGKLVDPLSHLPQ